MSRKETDRRPIETITLEDGSALNHRPLFTFKCAFCNKETVLTELEDGSLVITHKYPLCDQFSLMDLVEYLIVHKNKMKEEMDRRLLN